MSVSFEFDPLQDHLVPTDHRRMEIAAVATDQPIGFGRGVRPARVAMDPDVSFFDDKLGIHGDRTGRGHRPGIT